MVPVASSEKTFCATIGSGRPWINWVGATALFEASRFAFCSVSLSEVLRKETPGPGWVWAWVCDHIVTRSPYCDLMSSCFGRSLGEFRNDWTWLVLR